MAPYQRLIMLMANGVSRVPGGKLREGGWRCEHQTVSAPQPQQGRVVWLVVQRGSQQIYQDLQDMPWVKSIISHVRP